MKKFSIIIAGLYGALAFTSCKKALTEKPHTFLTPDNFYQTAADAQAAVNGVFSPLQDQKYYQRTVYIISEVSGDFFYPNPNSGDRGDIYQGTQTGTNGEVTNWWVYSYRLIKNANDVVTYVPGINMDTTSRNNLVGNARFLRGMAYFDLVRTYGDVPLLLSAVQSDLYPRKTEAAKVYDQVIADLKYAEANCFHMNKLTQIGMISSEAASAMLARVYLQRSSMSYAQATDNQDALAECNKVIAYSNANSSVLALSKNFADIFDVTKKNGPEIIFNVQFGASPNPVNLTNRMFDPSSGAYGGYGSFIGSNDFYNSFDAADTVRRRVTIGTSDGGFRWISKYRDPGVKATASGRNNWIVLRYADVLLMQSEAMNNINPADPNKFGGINQVRTRAGLNNNLLSLSNTPTSADFVNALVKERGWELAVEGHRRWDLLRFKKFQQIKAAQGYVIPDSKLLMPIPQSEIDLNPNLK
ncbi:MAG: RagB/SusD family nutrient uptake outer membrane protein [Filimonas sp.]|nr:RagB/SusD family nutrient uptake outer membrane protein [Filimonas sp.]